MPRHRQHPPRHNVPSLVRSGLRLFASCPFRQAEYSSKTPSSSCFPPEFVGRPHQETSRTPLIPNLDKTRPHPSRGATYFAQRGPGPGHYPRVSLRPVGSRPEVVPAAARFGSCLRAPSPGVTGSDPCRGDRGQSASRYRSLYRDKRDTTRNRTGVIREILLSPSGRISFFRPTHGRTSRPIP